jgi:hypothetical protein
MTATGLPRYGYVVVSAGYIVDARSGALCESALRTHELLGALQAK